VNIGSVGEKKEQMSKCAAIWHVAKFIIERKMSLSVNIRSVGEKKEQMFTGAAIWHVAKFIIFASLAIFLAYYLYDVMVLIPQRLAEIDREYQAEMDQKERGNCLNNSTYAEMYPEDCTLVLNMLIK
jgi:hypothetical protein